MQVETIQLEDAAGTQQVIRRAGEVFAAGGLVVFPTETVYGIGASAASSHGLAALRQFKQRPDVQPFTVHIPTPAAAERYIDLSQPMLARLIRKVFPGPVTLVVDVNPDVVHARMRVLSEVGVPANEPERLYHQGTIGLRCPDDYVAQQVLGSTEAPVVASSANRRGQSPPHNVEEAAAAVGDEAQLVIDGGVTRYAKPSTIVRVHRAGNISVERGGVYDERFIRKLMRWTMLLVCSGNTCRSPMAQAIAMHMLAEQRKIGVEDLETAGIRVVSAGAFATPGMPATAEAVDALGKMNIDLSGHRSTVLTQELIHEADVIYCMTRSHLDAVLRLVPAAAGKAMLLDSSGDIEDPIGSGVTAYQRCAELIRRRLDQRLKEQQP